MGMYILIIALENNLILLGKVEGSHSLWFRNSPHSIYPTGNEYLGTPGNLYKTVESGVVYNNTKQKITQVSIPIEWRIVVFILKGKCTKCG